MNGTALVARVALAAGIAMLVQGCGGEGAAAPACEAGQRLATVAQSVPGAAYVPCVSELPAGWRVTSFDVGDDGTALTLRSDRADEPVDVRFDERCDIGGATPVAPRDEGVRTYLGVDGVSPRYAGRLLDVFAGGCVSYRFDFERGPHIALIDELQQAMGLYSRRQLRQELRDDLGVDLDASPDRASVPMPRPNAMPPTTSRGRWAPT